jgi:hypothetical protein
LGSGEKTARWMIPRNMKWNTILPWFARIVGAIVDDKTTKTENRWPVRTILGRLFSGTLSKFGQTVSFCKSMVCGPN